jgi:radical SAM protein with 4Fe4S-binding SPASM domain
MDTADYGQLFDELEEEHGLFVEISGIRSDPLSYSDFCGLLGIVKRKKFSYGIHTKGYFLNTQIIKLLNSESDSPGCITIGIDSANTYTYNKLHGLPPNSNVFNMVKENIIRLHQEREKRKSSLKIKLTYLLFAENSSEEQIKEFIYTFGDYADIIRFSIPQVPNTAEPQKYLKSEFISKTFDMLKNYENDKIIILNFRQSKHNQRLHYCWSQRFNATIDKAGNVFPCPQVALRNYANLILGNVKKDRFWNIWNSEKRSQLLAMSIKEMNCRVCDRKDESINIELNKLMKVNRFVISSKNG